MKLDHRGDMHSVDTTTLKQILLEELKAYTGQGLNAFSYLTENEAEQLYTVVDIANLKGKRLVSTVLIARIAGNQIIIELDHNNKELADALIARGVAENQIIRAYQGEAIPT